MQEVFHENEEIKTQREGYEEEREGGKWEEEGKGGEGGGGGRGLMRVQMSQDVGRVEQGGESPQRGQQSQRVT
eukprot:692652-Hanusia_phi.AAC.1